MHLLQDPSKSVRAWFVFAAALSPLPWDNAIYHGSFSAIAAVAWCLNMTIAVLFIFIALRFEKLLPKPSLIKVVLTVSMALKAISLAISFRSGVQGHFHLGEAAGGGISFAVSLRSGVPVSLVADLILSLAVCAYLLKRVGRLSTASAPKTA
jgi:hypothetical protein